MNATAVSESGGASGYARQMLFDLAARQDDRGGSFPVDSHAEQTTARPPSGAAKTKMMTRKSARIGRVSCRLAVQACRPLMSRETGATTRVSSRVVVRRRQTRTAPHPATA